MAEVARGRLEGLTVIITGAGRGIGRTTAEAYAREGGAVIVNDVSADRVDETVAAIRGRGGCAEGCVATVGDRDAANRLVDAALATFGTLDVLVNNAAVSGTRQLLDFTEADFDREVRANLRGPVLLAQAAITRAMAPRGRGRIINLTSHAALRGAPNKTGYAATKLGLVGLTLAWAAELAPLRITVNCVAPAAWTDKLEALPEARRETLRIRLARDGVLGRLAMPEDVTGTMVFLASVGADHLTGQVIGANGQVMHLL